MEEDIRKLSVEIGKKIAGSPEVVCTKIETWLKDGSRIEYDSAKDQEFKQKWMDAQEY